MCSERVSCHFHAFDPIEEPGQRSDQGHKRPLCTKVLNSEGSGRRLTSPVFSGADETGL